MIIRAPDMQPDLTHLWTRPSRYAGDSGISGTARELGDGTIEIESDGMRHLYRIDGEQVTELESDEAIVPANQ